MGDLTNLSKNVVKPSWLKLTLKMTIALKLDFKSSVSFSLKL